jgi:hypothetical protein
MVSTGWLAGLAPLGETRNVGGGPCVCEKNMPIHQGRQQTATEKTLNRDHSHWQGSRVCGTARHWDTW